MKRIWTTVIAVIVACAATTVADPLPRSWFLAGSAPGDYNSGVDPSVAASGSRSAFLASRSPNASGFGTIMQTFGAGAFAGKRVRLSAAVRSQNVAGWAGVWMRVDGATRRALSFDNMQDRPITGTSDWHRVEVTLDVPAESAEISFGILLHGAGKVWIDDIRFDEVGPAQSVSQPRDLDFER